MPQPPARQTYKLPTHAAYSNHGRTPAAWVLMIGCCLGVLIVGLGLILTLRWVLIAGLVVIAVSLVASLVMRGMGLGQAPQEQPGKRDGDWYSD
ncbi:hypothetical protein MF406_08125 [Georgenia sp. TF02-10]|uniref:HGxxPAAW family protein n=1 Tax=Georgenia sp. TF02-10 TaxID=2917725 RepID=UPI001FA6D126|nr:HGxxPAAW family protein [Georgenia sp. TF02-10]UNX56155.1 hypothetical protein MF406_08125 [Georgenia sp. TF02-10]